MSSTLTCEICFDGFDLETRIPKSLSCCGKTACRKCLGNILRNQQPQCPWCKTDIYCDIDVHKTNFQLLDIVQEDSKWEKCPQHNEHMKLFCPQDKRKVCPLCGYTSECRNHGLIPLLDLKPTSEKRLSELQDHLSRTSEKKEQYDNVILQNRGIFQEMICDSFDKQIHELQKAKTKALMKAHCVLSHKQVEVNHYFGENSSLRAEVQKKIENHMSFLKAENPLSVIEEDLKTLKSRVESLIGQDVVSFEQQLSRIVPFVKERLDTAFSGRKQEDFPVILDQVIMETPVLERSEDIKEISLQVCGASVNFKKLENGSTTLTFNGENNKTIKLIRLDYQQVKESDGVSIDLESVELNEWNLKALNLVLSIQAKTSRVFVPSGYVDPEENLENFVHLFAILFKKPEEIKELEINLPANSFAVLINTVLPQLSSLKKLRIGYIYSEVSRQNLDHFVDNLSLLAPTLEDLYIIFDDSGFPVKRLSFLMPRMKKLFLSGGGNQLDDRLFSEMIQNLLISMPQIEHFHIDITFTSVTPSCIQAMKEKIRHIPNSSIYKFH